MRSRRPSAAAHQPRCTLRIARRERQPGEPDEDQTHVGGVVNRQAQFKALVEQCASLVQLTIRHGEGGELRPRPRRQPVVPESIRQLAALEQRAAGVFVTAGGYLQAAEACLGDPGPVRLVVAAEQLQGVRRLSDRAFVVAVDRRDPCESQPAHTFELRIVDRREKRPQALPCWRAPPRRHPPHWRLSGRSTAARRGRPAASSQRRGVSARPTAGPREGDRAAPRTTRAPGTGAAARLRS